MSIEEEVETLEEVRRVLKKRLEIVNKRLGVDALNLGSSPPFSGAVEEE